MAGMVDVSGKKVTVRKSLARGCLIMGGRAFALLKNGRLPKGDPLPLAEAAGLLAAKNAASHIPLCHPLPLDSVRFLFEKDSSLPGLRISCEAVASAKTGVEMEALAGVTAALLAVYDVVKQVDPALSITDVRLDRKEGGKSGLWIHPKARISSAVKKTHRPASLGSAAVVTVSDRCFHKKVEDTSGKLLGAGLKAMGFRLSTSRIVADEAEAIQKTVLDLSEKNELLVLTGGTGLSPRDVTPETIAPLCQRLIPGISEALRAQGSSSNPFSVLSRSLAGQRGRCLLICLPGSPSAVRDALALLEPLLPHAVHIAAGGGHP